MESNEMSHTVELFWVKGDSATMAARKAMVSLGLTVVEKVCPPSTADWVEFPFVREASGSSYYGQEGIDAFLARAKKQMAIGTR